MSSQFMISNPRMVAGELGQSGATIDFVVWRRGFYGRSPVTVDYEVAEGTATTPENYDGSAGTLSGTLTFNQYEQWKAIRINLVAGSVTQDETLTCTLTPSNTHRIVSGQGTGTGTIQVGKLFYIAADGLISNPGDDIANPTTYDNYETLMKVEPLSGGAGRTILFKRGDVFDVLTRPDIDCSRYGGTQANPITTGAYGDLNDPIPILDIYGNFGPDAGTFTNNPRHIWQDIEFRAPPPDQGGRPIFHSGNDQTTEWPQGTEYLRCIMRNHDDGLEPWLGFTNPQIDNCGNLRFMWNHVIKCLHYGFLVRDCPNSQVVGNRWTECGQEEWEGAIGWAASLLNCDNCIFTENFLDYCNQGFRYQGVGTPGVQTLYAAYNFARWSPTDDLPWEVRGGLFIIRGTLYNSFLVNNVSIGGMLAYVEEVSGPVETLQLTVSNNISYHNKRASGPTYNCLDLTFNRNDGVNVYHNTLIVDGEPWAAMVSGYSPVDDQDGLLIDRKNNIIIRINTSPSASMIKDLGNPNTMYNDGTNHYYDQGGKLMEKEGVKYDTLSAFTAVFQNEEQGSVEANPILMYGDMPFPNTPLAPIAAESILTHDISDIPRGTDSCAGAVHRPVVGSAPVYAE